MEAAGLAHFAHGPRRSGIALVASLLGLAVVAWGVTGREMAGMEATPGMPLGPVGFYLLVWVVMMAAMMLPSVSPTVVVYERLRAGHRQRGRGAPAYATAVFVAGYLALWTLLGLLGYLLIEVGRGVAPPALAWDEAGRWVAGGVIAAAAVYQLTPLKEACLVRCRGPLMFLAERWRNGTLGALRLGAVHGAWCVGCCWALMAALFAVGVMSLGWMALIAGFIASEKLLPWPRLARIGVALLLLALGAAVALVPEHVPGLMLPDAAHMSAGN